MARQKHEVPPDNYSILQYSELTGQHRNTIARRLKDMDVKPVKGGETGEGWAKYRLRDLVNATIGGDLEAEKLRKITAEANMLESKLKQRSGELIPIGNVIRLTQNMVSGIRSRIIASTMPADERDELLTELEAMKNDDCGIDKED